MKAGFVVIGRNEGERLITCLDSLNATGIGPIVYVDSGSTDASVAEAGLRGASTVLLDMSLPFTAARARNEGLRQLSAIDPSLEFVQFIDGDCTLAQDWMPRALAFLESNPDFAVVCGRRRERQPHASLYNRLCDLEWNTPVGEAQACGGDALMRIESIAAVGGYREDLIAGEEPELCVRLRAAGLRIWRLDAEMTMHDAAMSKFGQWWRRSERAGHAFAEVANLHRSSPAGIWRAETRRALLWAGLAPAALALGLTASPAFFAGLLAYPAQVLRLYVRYADDGGDALPRAVLSVIGKFAETKGAISFWVRHFGFGRRRLIEYK
ncbi:MAG: glycosyltransferase family 2 protein [Sphingomonadales bacterium]|nr:glycosyltransferase family 2 protein [Sphingomonadales bacterium]